MNKQQQVEKWLKKISAAEKKYETFAVFVHDFHESSFVATKKTAVATFTVVHSNTSVLTLSPIIRRRKKKHSPQFYFSVNRGE